MTYFGSTRFVPPPDGIYSVGDDEYVAGSKTYAHYNYLKPGLASKIKRAHFEEALKVARPWFHKANVIDFGAADGVFIPSLKKYFEHVTAVDIHPDFVEVARRLVAAERYDDVQVVCNSGMGITELRDVIGDRPRDLAFSLEVFEHVGDPADPDHMYESKVDLLGDVLSLLTDNGRAVISVPRMVGLPFLLQRLGLWALRMQREPYSWQELVRAGLLKDVSAFESEWSGGHRGFNHLRLEEAMKQRLTVERKVNLLFQTLYVVGRPIGVQ